MKIEGFANLLAAQQNFAKAMGGNTAISQLAEIAKATSAQQKMIRSNFPISDLGNYLKVGLDTSHIAAISGKLQSSFESNEFTLTMKLLHENNQKMFAGWKSIDESNPFQDILKRLQDQQDAIFGSIRKPALFDIASLVQERLNKHAGEAAVIAGEVQAHTHLTIEDFDKLKIFVTDSISTLDQTVRQAGKSPMAIVAFIMTLIGFLYMIYAELKPTPASEQQIIEIRQMLEKHVTDTIREYGEERQVRVKCSMRLKAKLKSLFIHKLAAGDLVQVIALNHEWAYVTVLDKDDMPVSGWILKKNLW